ncbi:hypothetical protein ACEWY4_018082 [Coilia grayii]|uniref:Arginine vasopressin-induced protein 1 n=1 Tax=Coilia grayii TaxID=363190 RepID=A0ABD1JIM3_9TELE
MDDLASPSVLPGPSHVPCWRPTDRQVRKTGTHDIFQGVNLHQLRRLFQVAGEQDADQRARLVWRGGGGRRADKGDLEEEEVGAEVEIGLAQALVGLRVRARTRSGIRAEGHRDAHRRARASTQRRCGDAPSRQPADDLDVDSEAGYDKKELDQEGSTERQVVARSDKEMVDVTSDRSGARERDPERHLHRIRH